jgi:hypothetical protein
LDGAASDPSLPFSKVPLPGAFLGSAGHRQVRSLRRLVAIAAWQSANRRPLAASISQGTAREQIEIYSLILTEIRWRPTKGA